MGKRFKKGEKIQGYAEAYGTVVGVIVDIDETSMVDPYRVEIESGAKIWVQESGAKLVPAWQPKVGDRVRYSDKHVSGVGVVKEEIGTGELEWMVRVEDKDLDRAYYHGNTCRAFQTSSLSQVEVRAAAPAALTIEAGKFYKTRDGRKVGPMKTWGDLGSKYDFSAGGFLWKSDGENYDKDSVHTIVALWEEPASNDNAAVAKPKFKVGDVAEVVRSRPGLTSKVGKRIKINRVTSHALYATCEGTDNMVFHEDELELAGPALASSPAIVALIENGTPRPSTAPKVHTSQESATTEAERLALEHPGQQFGVFVLADSKIADEVITKTAVLRAA